MAVSVDIHQLWSRAGASPHAGHFGDVAFGSQPLACGERFADDVAFAGVAAHEDLAAAELAGARVPANIDGISMVNALLGKPQKDHEHLYWEFHERGFSQAVRTGDWKAIRQNGGKLSLYNLKEDLGETRDLAEAHPDIVARIEAFLKTARTESENWPSK